MEYDAALVVVVVGRAGDAVFECRVPVEHRNALAVVDALCRSQLGLRRRGLRLEIGASAEWRTFLDECGFADALPGPPARSVVEVLGETEDGEQLRVEEVVVPDDPVA